MCRTSLTEHSKGPFHASGAFSMSRRQAHKSGRLARRNKEIFLSHAHLIDIALNASQCWICTDLATSSMLEARVHESFSGERVSPSGNFPCKKRFRPGLELITSCHCRACRKLAYIVYLFFWIDYNWMNSILMWWLNGLFRQVPRSFRVSWQRFVCFHGLSLIGELERPQKIFTIVMMSCAFRRVTSRDMRRKGGILMKILSNAALDCELKQRKGRLTSHQYECFKFAVQHHWTVSLHQFCVLACALFARSEADQYDWQRVGGDSQGKPPCAFQRSFSIFLYLKEFWQWLHFLTYE